MQTYMKTLVFCNTPCECMEGCCYLEHFIIIPSNIVIKKNEQLKIYVTFVSERPHESTDINLPALNRAGRFFLCRHPSPPVFFKNQAFYYNVSKKENSAALQPAHARRIVVAHGAVLRLSRTLPQGGAHKNERVGR